MNVRQETFSELERSTPYCATYSQIGLANVRDAFSMHFEPIRCFSFLRSQPRGRRQSRPGNNSCNVFAYVCPGSEDMLSEQKDLDRKVWWTVKFIALIVSFPEPGSVESHEES